MKLGLSAGTLALGTLLMLGVVASPVAAVGAIVGTGTVPAAGCPAQVPITVRESLMTAGVWRVDYGFLCATSTLTFSGPYDPAVGACLPHVLVANPATFCLGPVAVQASLTTTSISLCTPGLCQLGTADVVRV